MKFFSDIARHFIAMRLYELQKNYKKTTMKVASGIARINKGYALRRGTSW